MKPILVALALPVLLLAACTTDRPAAPASQGSGASIEVVPLRYAAADEIVALVQELTEASKHAVSQPPSGAVNGPVVRPVFGPQFRILSDPRTNALILTGTPEELATVKALVARLDVEVR